MEIKTVNADKNAQTKYKIKFLPHLVETKLEMDAAQK